MRFGTAREIEFDFSQQAEEAWMSITSRHRIAARWRIGMNLKSLVWAARGARALGFGILKPSCIEVEK